MKESVMVAERVATKEEFQKIMEAEQSFIDNTFLIDETLQGFVSEDVAKKIKEKLKLYLFINGTVKFIQTLAKETVIEMEGFNNFMPKATFRFPPNKAEFLDEFKRAQNFEMKVMVVFLGEKIYSVKLYR